MKTLPTQWGRQSFSQTRHHYLNESRVWHTLEEELNSHWFPDCRDWGSRHLCWPVSSSSAKHNKQNKTNQRERAGVDFKKCALNLFLFLLNQITFRNVKVEFLWWIPTATPCSFLAHCSGFSLQSFVTYFSINYYKLKYFNTKKASRQKKSVQFNCSNCFCLVSINLERRF